MQRNDTNSLMEIRLKICPIDEMGSRDVCSKFTSSNFILTKKISPKFVSTNKKFFEFISWNLFCRK